MGPKLRPLLLRFRQSPCHHHREFFPDTQQVSLWENWPGSMAVLLPVGPEMADFEGFFF